MDKNNDFNNEGLSLLKDEIMAEKRKRVDNKVLENSNYGHSEIIVPKTNSNKVKISVIVPCYKVEQFLKKCVNSIINSTFKDFEVILVDDGSPDNSGQIADELTTKDKRIRVIHKQNEGVVKARETGVTAARGEWITFVDADDSITPNALEDLYNASINKDTDLVIGFPLGRQIPELPANYDISLYRADTISGVRINVALWGRLMRRSTITPFLFDVSRKVHFGEDMLFNIRYAFATNKNPIIVKSYVYDYFTGNEGSISHTNKRTPEYEQYFHELRLISIPKNDRNIYMKNIIADRLHPIQWWSFHNPIDISWMDSEFAKTLRLDIEKYSYPLSKRQNVMLNMRCKLIRLLLIPFYRVFK